MLVPTRRASPPFRRTSEQSQLRSVELQCPNLILAEPSGYLRRLFAIWGDAQQLATALQDVALSRFLRSKTRCGEAAALPRHKQPSDPGERNQRYTPPVASLALPEA